MNYFWEYCWIVSVVTIIISIVCTITNNRLFVAVQDTIDQMTNKIKPSLLLYHKPLEARFITTDELPMLKVWHNECVNYGVINIIGIITSVALAISLNVFHQLTYIITLGSAMFLGSNLMFYPRAYSRRHRVTRMLTNYYALIEMLDIVEKAKDTPTENTNGNREQDIT